MQLTRTETSKPYAYTGFARLLKDMESDKQVEVELNNSRIFSAAELEEKKQKFFNAFVRAPVADLFA